MDLRTEVERQLAVMERNAETLLPRDELARKIEWSLRQGRPLRVKLGIDPSASQLTFGHAVVLRKLREFQELGHTAVLVVGDFTRRIGDPSGKSKTREPMSPEEIERNMRTYREQAFRILDPRQAEVRYNSEWLEKLTLAQVIGLTARYTVARMLEREDFQRRFREGSAITIMEFLYPLAQAYDSVVVRADVELGGSDQRFNLLIGRDIQEAYGQAPQVILTMPLLLGTDGTFAMSQSRGNYIGVGEEPEEQFGKIMSLPDELMPQYYQLLTDIPWEEVASLHPKEAKKRLAATLVAWLHGEDGARRGKEHFERVFEEEQPPEEMPEVAVGDLLDADGTANIVDLVIAAGLVSSRSAARRLVEGGAVELNGDKISSPRDRVVVRTGAVLRAGKLRFVRLKP
ncbi:MAG TPA: tyrosine--tRNA ligase [Candidatus Bipolaricaulis sp.]|nr:tyrosine--tRNA ligase [Candidatus Bipolaricaulis sp.]HRS13577.1 tyrosine--tRNA ligase [Candidatus Bipolaricaulis sp.]HRU21993.1 tyrosine--tRNA ligase [Candidatus Bipolaricaulis sp.]